MNPIRKDFHTINISLNVRNAAGAIDFYRKAFGATELSRMNAPDGSIVHAEIKIGDSIVMLSDENEQWGNKSPQTIGGSPFSLRISVPNVDEFAARAVAAGLQELRPVADAFWGDRTGFFQDPFGFNWSIATQIEAVSDEELERRGREFFSAMK